MNYEELSDFEINKRVAVALGHELTQCSITNIGLQTVIKESVGKDWVPAKIPDYCNNPADAWPIIIENKMTVQSPDNGILNLSKEEWDVSASCYIGEDCMCFSYLNKKPITSGHDCLPYDAGGKVNEFYYTYMVITFAGIAWASLELAWGEYIEQTKGNVAAMGFGWAVWLFMLGWGLLS